MVPNRYLSFFWFTVSKFGAVTSSIHDYAKDGGEELFTKMHCVRITNP